MTSDEHKAEKPPEPNGWSAEERQHHRVERGVWYATLIVSSIASLGAIAGIIISIEALHEAQDAGRTARKQLIAQDRPYVSADYDIGKSIDMRNEDGLVIVKIDALLKNEGHSPATAVNVSTGVVITSDTSINPDIREGEKVQCQNGATIPPTGSNGDGRSILFPGKNRVVSRYIDLELFELQPALKKARPDDKYQMILFGCALYTNLDDESVHSTGFAYRVKSGSEWLMPGSAFRSIMGNISLEPMESSILD